MQKHNSLGVGHPIPDVKAITITLFSEHIHSHSHAHMKQLNRKETNQSTGGFPHATHRVQHKKKNHPKNKVTTIQKLIDDVHTHTHTHTPTDDAPTLIGSRTYTYSQEVDLITVQDTDMMGGMEPLPFWL